MNIPFNNPHRKERDSLLRCEFPKIFVIKHAEKLAPIFPGKPSHNWLIQVFYLLFRSDIFTDKRKHSAFFLIIVLFQMRIQSRKNVLKQRNQKFEISAKPFPSESVEHLCVHSRTQSYIKLKISETKNTTYHLTTINKKILTRSSFSVLASP